MGGGVTVIEEIRVAGGGGGGSKNLAICGGGGGFFLEYPNVTYPDKQMLCNWGCISYVKSRAMTLNLVEYKSPVQNVIAYARIACLLLKFFVTRGMCLNC